MRSKFLFGFIKLRAKGRSAEAEALCKAQKNRFSKKNIHFILKIVNENALFSFIGVIK